MQKKLISTMGLTYYKCHVSVRQSSILPKQSRNYHLSFLKGLRDCRGQAISRETRAHGRGTVPGGGGGGLLSSLLPGGPHGGVCERVSCNPSHRPRGWSYTLHVLLMRKLRPGMVAGSRCRALCPLCPRCCRGTAAFREGEDGCGKPAPPEGCLRWQQLQHVSPCASQKGKGRGAVGRGKGGPGNSSKPDSCHPPRLLHNAVRVPVFAPT